MNKYTICLDIGGTKVLGAVFDKEGKIVHRLKKKTGASEGFSNVEETIVSVVRQLLSEYGISVKQVNAISAGAPGIINNDTGVVLFSPNLPWKNYAIKKSIEKIFGVPFFIGNDVNLGVLGEWTFGVAQGLEHVVGMFIGTGLGGGLILNGNMYSGHQYKGAEFGHMILNIDGPQCNCGQRGCLEAFSSKTGMTDYIRQQIRHGRKTTMEAAVSKGVFKSKEMKTAFNEGDEVMIEAIDRSCLYLAVAAGNLVNMFSPEMVVFGGGVMEALGKVFLQKILAKVNAYCLPSVRESVRFEVAALGDDSILYGALALVLDQNHA
ncbi:MAG: ROK family protein [Clostridiales bacterium]|nr:ROK family protein [Clostridiales bacterium]